MQDIQCEYAEFAGYQAGVYFDMKDIRCEYAEYEGYEEGVYRI